MSAVLWLPFFVNEWARGTVRGGETAVCNADNYLDAETQDLAKAQPVQQSPLRRAPSCEPVVVLFFTEGGGSPAMASKSGGGAHCDTVAGEKLLTAASGAPLDGAEVPAPPAIMALGYSDAACAPGVEVENVGAAEDVDVEGAAGAVAVNAEVGNDSEVDPQDVGVLEAAVDLKQWRLRGLLRRVSDTRARRPQLVGGATVDTVLAGLTAAAAAAARPTDRAAEDAAARTVEAHVAAAGVALQTTVMAAVTAAAGAVADLNPSDDDNLLVQRARRAASLVASTARGLPRRATDAEGRRSRGHPALPGRRACARCRSRTHKTGYVGCPAKTTAGTVNPHAYDRGEDADATDPYANRATVVSSVMVPLAVVVRGLSPKGATRQGVPPMVAHGAAAARDRAVRDAFVATAEHHTQLHFTLTLVWLNTIHALYAAVGKRDRSSSLPSRVQWPEYWNWRSYAVSCRGAAHSGLPANVKCGACGQLRSNSLCGASAARLMTSHPPLMCATQRALAGLAFAFDAACHEHLPARNSNARWSGVVNTIVTHTQRTVAVATRRLAWRVATAVTDGTAVEGDSDRKERHASIYAAAKSCLARGSDAPHAAHDAKLDTLPLDLRAAALRAIAAARRRAQPQPAGDTPPLFPTGGADALSSRWAEYIPYLLHVQQQGVDKPFALVPGKAASLHGYGTVTKARLVRLVNRVCGNDKTLRAAVKERGAAAIAARLGMETSRTQAGADLRTNGEGVVFSLSRPATAAEAEAADVTAATRKANGCRVQQRLTGSPTTQLEKQGFPVADVKSLTLVSVDPGKATILTATSTGPTAADWATRPWVCRRRLARSRLVAADALTRVAVVFERVVWRAAALSASEAADAETTAAAAAGGGPSQTPPLAPTRKRRAAPVGADRSTRSRVTNADQAQGNSSGNAAHEETEWPSAVEESACRSHRRGRGPAATLRRGARRELHAAVRRLLTVTGNGRWQVPRHSSVDIALACLPMAANGWHRPHVSDGRPDNAAHAASKTEAAAQDVAAAGAFASALQNLTRRVADAVRSTRGRRRAPPDGAVYTLSRGRYAEAAGNGMTARAAAAHRALAVQRLADHQPPSRTTPETLAAHDTIRTANPVAVLAASRQWMDSRRQELYKTVWGAAATAGVRKARVHQVIQRRKMAAAVARELTGGRLRRIVNRSAVVVVMGQAATQGGATWLRRHLRRLCWMVDMEEHNSSQACSGCKKQLAIVYASAVAAPPVPRGSLICGRRRGCRGRQGRPSATQRGAWTRTKPVRYATRRAACRADGVRLAAEQAAKYPPPRWGRLSRPRPRWSVGRSAVCGADVRARPPQP